MSLANLLLTKSIYTIFLCIFSKYTKCIPYFVEKTNIRIIWGLPRWLSGKESIGRCRISELNPWFGKISGEGNGNLLQYSCLGNPVGRGAWWATVHGVAKSQTQLSTHTHTYTHKNNLNIRIFDFQIIKHNKLQRNTFKYLPNNLPFFPGNHSFLPSPDSSGKYIYFLRQ